jgi:PucR C-terminal helix-turn-helix domain
VPVLPSTFVSALIREEEVLVDAVSDRIAGAGNGQDPAALTRRDLEDCARPAVAGLIHRLGLGDAGQIGLEPFVAHARSHRMAGGSLRDLLSVYRLGGLAVLEYARNMPEARSLDTGTLLRFTAEVFSFIEELSVAAADGFTALESSFSGQEHTLRTRLHSLLLHDPPVPPETLADAARLTGWPLPRRIRVAVAVGSPDPAPSATPSRVVWGPVNGHWVLVVEDDDESERWLARAADSLDLERPLVIGPAVGVERGRQAATQAIALSNLLRSDPLRPVPEVVRCEAHEVDLLLAVDVELSQSLSERMLAPLAGLTAVQRDRMLDTLEAWLANPGRPRAMAGQLHLHVQGVRYRLDRLRALFGDALDDPQGRFELAVALRVRRLYGAGPRPHPSHSPSP